MSTWIWFILRYHYIVIQFKHSDEVPKSETVIKMISGIRLCLLSFDHTLKYLINRNRLQIIVIFMLLDKRIKRNRCTMPCDVLHLLLFLFLTRRLFFRVIDRYIKKHIFVAKTRLSKITLLIYLSLWCEIVLDIFLLLLLQLLLFFLFFLIWTKSYQKLVQLRYPLSLLFCWALRLSLTHFHLFFCFLLDNLLLQFFFFIKLKIDENIITVLCRPLLWSDVLLLLFELSYIKLDLVVFLTRLVFLQFAWFNPPLVSSPIGPVPQQPPLPLLPPLLLFLLSRQPEDVGSKLGILWIKHDVNGNNRINYHFLMYISISME